MGDYSLEIRSSIPRRYYELDSIRGLASLSVFFSHCLLMITISGHFGIFGTLIENSALHIFWDGGAAVILFFVLSGFVLALPYVGETPKPIDIIPFIVRRAFRIYPAYFFALIIAFVLKQTIFMPNQLTGFSWIVNVFWQWNINDLNWNVIKYHLFMVHPGLTRVLMGIFIPVIWSLVVEMQVSLVFPFIIPIIKRMNKWWTGFILFMVSLVLCYILFNKLNLEFLRYLPLFVLGGLLANFKNELTNLVKAAPILLKTLIGIIAVLLYTFRYSIYQPFLERFNFANLDILGRKLGTANIDCAIDYIIGLGVAVIIIYAISVPRFSQFLHIRPVKFLGDISYSFYLLHFPVLLTVSSVIYAYTHSIVAAWTISLIITVSLSYILFTFIEKPFQNAGRIVSKKLRLDIFKKNDVSHNVSG